STINVSGKEKGGRAIVWGDVALINGNINAQGSDIAETGGFVETSGHYLSINSNAVVKTKEWLLDPDDVIIEAETPSRTGQNVDIELPFGQGTANNPKKNGSTQTTLTNKTISEFLQNAKSINITAKRKLTVNSSIDIGTNSNLTLWSDGQNGQGVQIDGDITSATNGNLTIYSGGWVDVHKNITLNTGHLNITSKNGDIAFENGNNLTITGQGTITSGNQKGFRFDNVSLNGIKTGLLFTTKRPEKPNSNGCISNHFRGTLNISGFVNISMSPPKAINWHNRLKGRSYWNVTRLNVSEGSTFNVTINSRVDLNAGYLIPSSRGLGLNGISFTNDTVFDVKKGSKVNFKIDTQTADDKYNLNYASFDGNISVLGGGDVSFELASLTSNLRTHGAVINSKNFNVSGGSSLNFKTKGSTNVGFLINNDLTLNATGGNISLLQVESIDGMIGKGVVANKNITFEGGNITFGSKKAITEIKGNVTINNNANVTLIGSDFDNHQKPLTIKKDVIINNGNLTAGGNVINIEGNLTVAKSAKLQAITNYTFNVSGLFDNQGKSNISIARGGAKFKDINNTSSLNITTNSSNTYRTIIEGNITNKKGDLNITDNKGGAEIQIGGNISQKEGNLTISSDRINITNQITIKKGVNGEDSNSDTASTANNANLTIKTKELKLTQDLNISGFDKAEITAKEGGDLIIGNNSDNGNVNAKTVTFNNVKDSKISASDHNVILNSKVKTSDGNGNAESDSDNNASLTIDAKNVTVNNNITSHKAVNITASEGSVTTRAGTTINATTGSVEVTAKTGDIKGGIESKSGSVTIAANGNTLTVGNVSGNTVTVTANSGALTTLAGSTIKGTDSVTTSSQSGEINGDINAENGAVTVTANTGTLSVANITSKTATLTASSGELTTKSGSKIEATEGEANVTSATGTIGGTISGKTVNVSATESLTTQSGSKIEATEGEANVTSKTGTINGKISGGAVNVTATAGSLTVKGDAKIEATKEAVTLTATKGTLTTNTGSSITSAKGQVDLSAKDSSIGGSIDAANVTLNTTGTLTTVTGSNINATSGTLVINAKDAKLDGTALGDRTEVNVTNANGSGSVIATTSSKVNITGDLITINGLNIISRNGKNTVLLKGVEIDVKYIQPGIASVNEVIEAKRALEKVKDLSDEEREALAKLGVSAVRFAEPNNAITINTQNEFTTRPSSQVTISEGKVCFLIGNGATICTNIADIER
ncbi:adhesin, partial [Haemophilus influenzae]|nr:adhesin [Haemophilus influenzae]